MGKSRKKSWKKIPRTADEELLEVHKQKELQKLTNDQLFELDDDPKPVEKLTLKQKRLCSHRERLSKFDEAKDNKKPARLSIQKRERIKLPSKLEKTKIERLPKILPSGVKANLLIDPWAEEDKIDMEGDFLAPGKHHELKTRKMIKVNEPKTRKYIPSALLAVKVADPGASYNPEMNDYMEYANKIAGEEIARDKAEKKLERQIGLPLGSKYLTAEEQQKELEQGFYEENTDEDEDVKLDIKPELLAIKKQPKAKSDKQKKRELKRKIVEMERKAKKSSTKRDNEQIANLKKLYKEIDQKISQSKEKAAERKTSKLLTNLTKRKTLGRGEFKEYEEPVVLPSEIKGSLRLAKTEGSLMSEHMKSLQARNILAVAGEKETHKLPKRLKRKFVEKWDVKNVTPTSTRH
jgi:hypothetical protein